MKMMRPASMRAVQRSMAPARRYMSTQQQQSSSTGTHAAAVTSEASTSVSLGKWKPDAEIRMLYDGECSLCMKEVKFLQGRDAAAGKIDFVDIAEPSYSPEDNAGITFQAAMERIHAILPDGTIVKDIEVFRRLYEAVGLGWVYAITKNKAVEDAGNAVYNVWAKYRTQITGREALDVILARHRAEQEGRTGSLCRDSDGNVTAACDLPGASSSSSSSSSQ
ncbi:hypothetical protein OEZ85_008117 [Tetradesmus obliquus]|uniref:Thiol-disulfide oxidoreductase DCC n=1 Tax=Tetradesmus obliquus TaxID=3088 RepID=A0ABY8THY5_TETOB|nr:hypothetical protein OEZ85_008117 [Tetradesmus obliquus]